MQITAALIDAAFNPFGNFRNAVAAACSVAPVVETSSINHTCFPASAAVDLHTNASFKFSARRVRESSRVCAVVGRTRRNRLSTAHPEIPATSRANSSA